MMNKGVQVAQGCARMSKDVQGCTKICKGAEGYARVCKDVQRYAKMHKDAQGSARMHKGVQGCAKPRAAPTTPGGAATPSGRVGLGELRCPSFPRRQLPAAGSPWCWAWHGPYALTVP